MFLICYNLLDKKTRKFFNKPYQNINLVKNKAICHRRWILLDKDKTIKIKLENLAYGGDCVAHLDDGYTIFVNGGIPGEIVKVKITAWKKSYARADIVEIIKPSPMRVSPECKVYTKCGGCQLQHMNYKQELSSKQRMVKDSLERIGKIESPEIKKVIESDFPWYYRNKAQFPLRIADHEKIRAGFYRRGTHELINVNKCVIQHPLINRIMEYTLNILNEHELTVYDENEHYGLLRHLLIRVGVCTNQAILTIITNDQPFPEKYKVAEQIMEKIPELTGVIQNINSKKTNVIMGNKFILLAGERTYTEYIASIKYKISSDSFFQVNTLQAHKLYDVIKSLCTDKRQTVIDCYCGTGSITLYLANKIEKILGIEENKSAVKDARVNAELNNIDNCKFICGRVETELPLLKEKGIKPDIIIFDPPRKGLKEDIISVVEKLKPQKIVYVSCNPTTLARDLAKLTQNYYINLIQPVDMFPQTYHVETVVSLNLK